MVEDTLGVDIHPDLIGLTGFKTHMPRWGSLKPFFPHDAMGCVQTTRGRPVDYDFCDVIYLYGRKARHKKIAVIIEKIKTVSQLGKRNIFINDYSSQFRPLFYRG